MELISQQLFPQTVSEARLSLSLRPGPTQSLSETTRFPPFDLPTTAATRHQRREGCFFLFSLVFIYFFLHHRRLLKITGAEITSGAVCLVE